MTLNSRAESPQKATAASAATDAQRQPASQTKHARMLELIGKEGGATTEALTSATGWLPHTMRAVITGLRKCGHDIRCVRAEGVSRYMIGSSDQ